MTLTALLKGKHKIKIQPDKVENIEGDSSKTGLISFLSLYMEDVKEQYDIDLDITDIKFENDES